MADLTERIGKSVKIETARNARSIAMAATRYTIGAVLFAGFVCLAGLSQSPVSDSPGRSLAKVEAVEYLYPEQVTIPSGKTTAVALHFRIADGLHINSHTPSENYLIPTEFSVPSESGVRLKTATYPAGINFTLPLDPQTKLNVYTGEFTIQTRLVATAGDHLVEAKLHYQACDKSACMPPKTIKVPIDVIGK
jgi:hypothetical protein